MNISPEIDESVKRNARQWVTVMHSGCVDDETAERFKLWLNQDPDHAHAYHKEEQIWRDLSYVAEAAGVDVEAELQPTLAMRLSEWFAELRSRPAVAWGAGAVAAAVVAVLVVLPLINAGDIVPDYETEIAQIRQISLEDGSAVTLGAKSSIWTEFSESARRVKLLSGEAFFEVAKDESRPFFVAANDTVVRVVGTKFDIKHGFDQVHVSVLEGIVEVIKADNFDEAATTTARRRLTAGQKVVATEAPALPAVQSVETEALGTWRTGRLTYENASLAEIISDVNRYHDRPLRFAESELGDIRLTTAFRTDEIDQMLEVLEALQPIVVDRTSGREIVLRPAHDDG